jgi:hypothetical protein
MDHKSRRPDNGRGGNTDCGDKNRPDPVFKGRFFSAGPPLFGLKNLFLGRGGRLLGGIFHLFENNFRTGFGQPRKKTDRPGFRLICKQPSRFQNQ